MARLPIEHLPARIAELNLNGAEVHHLPDWKGYDDPKKLEVLRHIALMRGRDPRIANLAVSIIKKAGAQPREYAKQAAALLRWVQNPRNIYYVNEPGERLQDPIFTIKQGWGDCLPEGTLLLRDDHQLVPIESISPGDRIWGYDKWTEVLKSWGTGEKTITEIRLNSGNTLWASENHKVFVWSANEEMDTLRVSDLTEGMRLVRPINEQKTDDPHLRISKIYREGKKKECFDITTEDAYVFLPDVGCVVHNCDDQCLALAALFESIRLPWKFVLAGTDPDGNKIRHIEGGRIPPNGKWSHIYLIVGTPPFNPKRWYFAETTIDKVPLGWDVVDGSKAYLPEMERPKKGPAKIVSPPPAPLRFRPSSLPPRENRSPAYDMAYGQASALSPMAAAVGASIAAELDNAPSSKFLDARRLVPAILSGVLISVGSTILISWIKPKLGLK